MSEQLTDADLEAMEKRADNGNQRRPDIYALIAALREARAERDALAADLETVQTELDEATGFDAAEVERVKRLEKVVEAAKKLVRPCLCCDEGYEDAVCTCTDYPESLAKLRAALAELDAGEGE